MFKKVIIFFCAFAWTSAMTFVDEECLDYTVYPVQYDITIIPYVYNHEQSYYNCELIITVIANAPDVRIIELDAMKFDILNLSVYDEDRIIINRHRPYEYKNEKLLIYLQEPLLQYKLYQKKYNIVIHFRNNLNSDSTRGIFLVPYEVGGKKQLIVTRFSPNKAKYFIPCFDNPRFEAVFKFKVYIVPAMAGIIYANNTLVTAKQMRQQVLKENYILIEFSPSPQVALHQIAFHYSDFGSSQVTARRTNDTIIIWTSPSRLPHYAYILTFSERILNLIHEYAALNVSRPLMYGPINIVSVPSNIDGFESQSWNLMSNGETRLAYIPHLTSIKLLEKMRFELTQQLCRLWLGNPGEFERTRWREEWFKEGVATYLAYYLLAQYDHGVYTMKYERPLGIYGLQMKHKAMAEDWHHSTPALITFNNTLTVEIPVRYKYLVQMKTASLLWMIENWLGSEKFHTTLVKYINTRRGNYISLQNFLTTLDTYTVECQHEFFNGSTASKILDSWFRQHGYPVINVNVLRDRTPNAIQLKQHKFSFNHGSRRDSNYLIPISYLVQNNENCFNCYQPRFTIDHTYTFEENLNGGWIILNRNASGYYRVNYDTVTWHLIAQTLKENRNYIDEQNRAQIVNDVFALYAANEMKEDLAREILDYLHLETSPVVWDSVISGFELLKMEGAACNMTKYLYKDWKDFMSRKVEKMYIHLANDIEQQRSGRLFRSNIIDFACYVQNQQCVKDLSHMYREYTHGRQKLDPDSRAACYYMTLSDNVNYENHGFNAYEMEDKVMVEHKLARENRFLYRIPEGHPKPEKTMIDPTPSLPPPANLTQMPESLSNRAPLSSLASVAIGFIAIAVIAIIR